MQYYIIVVSYQLKNIVHKIIFMCCEFFYVWDYIKLFTINIQT